MKQLSSLLKISVSVLFLFLHLTASGDNPFSSVPGAAEAGMGYSCVAGPGFWSAFHNQALLPAKRSLAIGFNYLNRFNIKELGTRSAGIIIPLGNATVGAVYSHFGYSDFNRQSAGLACGLNLSEKISAGVQIDYFSERTSGEYDTRQALTFETGLSVKPSENVIIGIHVFNPLPNTLRKTSIPSTLRIGAGSYLNSTLFAALEAEMSTGGIIILRTGFQYEAVKNIWMRGGFITESNSFCFGLGFLTKLAQIDLAFSTHETLGVTSSVSLIFKIK